MFEKFNNKKVDLKVFSMVIGVILLAMGWLFTISNGLQAKMNSTNHDIVEVKILLEGMKTDLEWIKAEVGRINNK